MQVYETPIAFICREHTPDPQQSVPWEENAIVVTGNKSIVSKDGFVSWPDGVMDHTEDGDESNCSAHMPSMLGGPLLEMFKPSI